MKLYAYNTGWQTVALRGFDQPRLRVPTPVFLIDHPEGLVLVDSGFHPDAVREPDARIGFPAKVVGFEQEEGEDVASRLQTGGVELGEIRYLVNTHLHFDHAGGNSLIPRSATMVVHWREWAAVCSPHDIVRNFYCALDYADPRPRLEVEGDHDLFGDGKITLVETPGHTPGHQSVRVTLDGGDVVLAGDSCYLTEWIDSGATSPIVGYDKEAEVASLARLRAMRDAGAHILVGHDPDQWTRIPEAPESIEPAAVS